MKAFWKKIKKFIIKPKKHRLLLDYETQSSEEIYEKINKAIEAKKKRNQRMKTQLMRRIHKLEAKAK